MFAEYFKKPVSYRFKQYVSVLQLRLCTGSAESAAIVPFLLLPPEGLVAECVPLCIGSRLTLHLQAIKSQWIVLNHGTICLTMRFSAVLEDKPAVATRGVVKTHGSN